MSLRGTEDTDQDDEKPEDPLKFKLSPETSFVYSPDFISKPRNQNRPTMSTLKHLMEVWEISANFNSFTFDIQHFQRFSRKDIRALDLFQFFSYHGSEIHRLSFSWQRANSSNSGVKNWCKIPEFAQEKSISVRHLDFSQFYLGDAFKSHPSDFSLTTNLLNLRTLDPPAEHRGFSPSERLISPAIKKQAPHLT
jgi:hypothetical protein